MLLPHIAGELFDRGLINRHVTPFRSRLVTRREADGPGLAAGGESGPQPEGITGRPASTENVGCLAVVHVLDELVLVDGPDVRGAHVLDDLVHLVRELGAKRIDLFGSVSGVGPRGQKSEQVVDVDLHLFGIGRDALDEVQCGEISLKIIFDSGHKIYLTF